MSWIGQSLATQSMSHRAGEGDDLPRVTTGWPAATACGPTTRTM